jgi:hypothetical protein
MLDVQQKQRDAMVAQALGSVQQSMSYLYQQPTAAATYPSGMGGFNVATALMGGQTYTTNTASSADNGQANDHATVTDAITGVATLATTALSIFGGGSSGFGN